MNDERIPSYLIFGLLLAVVMIGLSSVLSSRNLPANQGLVKQFVPQTPDPNVPTPAPWQLPQVRLPDLPPEIRQTVDGAWQRFVRGDQTVALTPVATNQRVRVEITSVQRANDQVQIKGTVTNSGSQPLPISTASFSFRDSTGQTYSVSGSGSVNLAAGQSTVLELSVPVPPERGIVLILNLPPDPPLEQTLLLAPT
jgi:hypothetical protein